MGRRSYGTGSLYVHTDAAGAETWYGRWRVGRRRVKRRIGPKRPAGSRRGLTRAQAERALQRMIETERPRPTRPDVSVEEAGERLISHLEALGRKPTTLGTYRSLLRAHLATHLGDEPLDRVGTEDVEALVAAMRRRGVGPKTIRNALALLHQILAFGQRNADVPPGPGFVAFQVPTEFQGVPVADRDFVRRAHASGHAVHVWTINDRPTIRELFEIGVDGVMTAAPSVLERVLCAEGLERPRRPRTFPGRHCNPRASIACTVRPRGPARSGRGGRVRVALQRRDQFAGPCAGWVSLRVRGTRGRAIARFDFGELPPGEGGPSRRVVGLRPRGAARRAVLPGGARARVAARPYNAFVTRARVRIR